MVGTLVAACHGESINITAADFDQDTFSNDNGTAYTTDSTDAVLCIYFYNEQNESESVSPSSYADWTCHGTYSNLTANGIPDNACSLGDNSGSWNIEVAAKDSCTLAL
ncbi:MAG: hypothetical protein ABJV04_11255 [Aliiglaciecola sp.]|uniref:hypothetical protein n=1 Tax=Aliiglaciecola sp. TaxID=1872441 RepID=UPI00329709D9